MSDHMLAWCLLLLAHVARIAVARPRTMDEIITNAADTIQTLAMPQPGLKQVKAVIVELDMMLTPAQWRREQTGLDMTRRQRRQAIRGTNYRWPEAIILYDDFSNSLGFSAKDKEEVRAAMEEWQHFTCLRFSKADNSQKNKIRFENGGGCYSYVGMVGGSQTVGLAPGCRWKSVVIHELGHAIGLHHEHTRPDRDDYVSIVEQNVPPNLLYNFRRYSRDSVQDFSVSYDYLSIMHYGASAFSINGQQTIRTELQEFQDVIGTAQGLSFLDIKLVNLMYSCSAKCSRHVECPPEGFLNKDCQCMCPGNPVQECSSSGRRTGSGSGTRPTTHSETGSEKGTTTDSSQCRDQYNQCDHWAQQGECEDKENKVLMQAYCPRSCSFCGHDPEDPNCRDKGEYCAFWKKEGHCINDFANFMQANCPRTCGFCQTHSSNRKSYRSEGRDDVRSDVKASGITSQPMMFTIVSAVICGLMP